MASALLPTYARADLAFERGEGAWLISTKGERYLDFGGGIAVASLGYSHPHLVAAARGERLLTIPAGDNVVRLLPPLVITDAEVNEAVERLSRACTELERTIPQRGAAE